MMVQEVPHGLSELLIVTALQQLQKEDCHSVLAGPAASDRLGKIGGMSKMTEMITRGAYQCAKKIFHLDRHQVYWKKFQPKKVGAYLVFPNKNLNYSSVKALLAAFNVNF
jgi:lysylphosphatidylglycerol synthetase-like protein (DUF2156 family)